MTIEEEAAIKFPIYEPCCRLVKMKIIWKREQYIAKNANKYSTNSQTAQERPKEV